MEFDFASLHHITNDDKELYAYADAEKVLNSGALTSLKFGLKYTDAIRTSWPRRTAGSSCLAGHGMRRCLYGSLLRGRPHAQ